MKAFLALAVMPDSQPRLVEHDSSETSVFVFAHMGNIRNEDPPTVCILIADAEALGREVTSASSIGRMSQVLAWCEQNLPSWAVENPHQYVAFAADKRYHHITQLHDRSMIDPIKWEIVQWPGFEKGSKEALEMAVPDYGSVLAMIHQHQPDMAI